MSPTGVSEAPKPRVAVMRSQLGRVRGLGAAKTGSAHWWAQRVTSIALLPLTLWFIVSVLRLAHAGRPQMLHWAHQPVNAVLLIAFIAATFHHLQLGMQVVIEDYVGGGKRIAVLMLTNGAIALVFLACLISALKLAL